MTSIIYIGMDVHTTNFTLCCYTMDSEWSDTLKPHTQGDIIKHRKGAADGTKIHGRI